MGNSLIFIHLAENPNVTLLVKPMVHIIFIYSVYRDSICILYTIDMVITILEF